MVPTSLSVWTQRYGRAGRAGQDVDAILLVEPSVYQLKKKKTTEVKKGEENKENEAEEEQDDDDDNADDERPDQVPASHTDPKFKKRVEWGMRNWVEATECRNAVSDKILQTRVTIEVRTLFPLQRHSFLTKLKLTTLAGAAAISAYSRKSSLTKN